MKEKSCKMGRSSISLHELHGGLRYKGGVACASEGQKTRRAILVPGLDEV